MESVCSGRACDISLKPGKIEQVTIDCLYKVMYEVSIDAQIYDLE